MSKIRYLLVILLLLLVGYVVLDQLDRAHETTHELLAEEVARRIDIRIREVFLELKRYPDAGDEFETLVLERLGFRQYRGEINVTGLVHGDAHRPAFFHVKTGPPGKEVVLSLAYYGCDYRENFQDRGKLVVSR